MQRRVNITYDNKKNGYCKVKSVWIYLNLLFSTNGSWFCKIYVIARQDFKIGLLVLSYLVFCGKFCKQNWFDWSVKLKYALEFLT